MLPQQSDKLREGIDERLPAFADNTTSIQMQEKPMNAERQHEAVPGAASYHTPLPGKGPSLQRASILFVASMGSFIGASLLLASL